MRILSPFPSGKTNIVLTGKGVARVVGAGGEVFDRCPYEDPHAQGIVAGTVDVFAGGPAIGRDEVQTLTPDVAPDGGTFTLALDGQETGDIPYDASASDIQDALEALANVGAGNVEVQGDLSSEIEVTFLNDLGKKPQDLLVVNSSLTDGSDPVTVSVAHTVLGLLPNSLQPELDLCGCYQVVPNSSEETSGGNTLVSLRKVEWVRNRFT